MHCGSNWDSVMMNGNSSEERRGGEELIEDISDAAVDENLQPSSMLECELEEGLPNSEWAESFQMSGKGNDRQDDDLVLSPILSPVLCIDKPVIYFLTPGTESATPNELVRIKISPTLKFIKSKCFAREKPIATNAQTDENFMGVLLYRNYLKMPCKWIVEKKITSKVYLNTSQVNDLKNLIAAETDQLSVPEENGWRNIEKYVRPGFFATYSAYELRTLLALTYHWSFCSDLDDILEDCKLPIGELFELWLQFKNVCSEGIEKCGLLGRSSKLMLQVIFGFQLIEVAVFKYGDHLIIAAMDRQSYLTSHRVLPFSDIYNCDKLVATVNEMIVSYCTVVTDCSLLKGLERYHKFVYPDPTITDPKNCGMHNLNVKNYFRRHMNNMFGRFSPSTVDSHILNLYLKELEWRERFGSKAGKAFWNILYSIAGQDIGKCTAHHLCKEEGKTEVIAFCDSTNDHELAPCEPRVFEVTKVKRETEIELPRVPAMSVYARTESISMAQDAVSTYPRIVQVQSIVPNQEDSSSDIEEIVLPDALKFDVAQKIESGNMNKDVDKVLNEHEQTALSQENNDSSDTQSNLGSDLEDMRKSSLPLIDMNGLKDVHGSDSSKSVAGPSNNLNNNDNSEGLESDSREILDTESSESTRSAFDGVEVITLDEPDIQIIEPSPQKDSEGEKASEEIDKQSTHTEDKPKETDQNHTEPVKIAPLPSQEESIKTSSSNIWNLPVVGSPLISGENSNISSLPPNANSTFVVITSAASKAHKLILPKPPNYQGGVDSAVDSVQPKSLTSKAGVGKSETRSGLKKPTTVKAGIDSLSCPDQPKKLKSGVTSADSSTKGSKYGGTSVTITVTSMRNDKGQAQNVPSSSTISNVEEFQLVPDSDISSSVIYMVEGYDTLTITKLLAIRTWPTFLVFKNASCLDQLGTSLAKKSLKARDYFSKPFSWLNEMELLPKKPCSACGYSKVKLFEETGPNIDVAGWICGSTTCKNEQSIIRPKFFSRFAFPMKEILPLLYHWVIQSKMEDVFSQVSLNEYKIRYVYWAIQKLCTNKIRSEFSTLGNYGHVVEVSVVQLGQYCILGALDRHTMFTRLKAMPAPIMYKASMIEAELEPWLEPWTVVVTNYKDFGIKKDKLVHVFSDPKSDMNTNSITSYIVELLNCMFGKYSSAGVKLEIIQGFLDEIQWRERYGPSPETAFWNLFCHISEEDGVDITKTHHYTKRPDILLVRIPMWRFSDEKNLDSETKMAYEYKVLPFDTRNESDSRNGDSSCDDDSFSLGSGAVALYKFDSGKKELVKVLGEDILTSTYVPPNKVAFSEDSKVPAGETDNGHVTIDKTKKLKGGTAASLQSQERSPSRSDNSQLSDADFATESEDSEVEEITQLELMKIKTEDSKPPQPLLVSDAKSVTVTAVSPSVVFEESIDVEDPPECDVDCVLLDVLSDDPQKKESNITLPKGGLSDESLWDSQTITLQKKMLKMLRPVLVQCSPCNSSSKKDASKKKTKKAKPEVQYVSLDEYYFARIKPPNRKIPEQRKYIFNCSLCKDYFYSNVAVMAHTLEHARDHKRKITNQIYHSCSYCLSDYKSECDLKQHVGTVHLSKISSLCLICCKPFMSTSELIKHMSYCHVPSEMPYVCPVCFFRTSVREEVTEHFNLTHHTEPHLMCPYCLKMCSPRAKTDQVLFTQTYCQHLLQHQLPSKTVKCPSCVLIFLTMTELNGHLFKDHISFADKENMYPFKPRLDPVIVVDLHHSKKRESVTMPQKSAETIVQSQQSSCSKQISPSQVSSERGHAEKLVVSSTPVQKTPLHLDDHSQPVKPPQSKSREFIGIKRKLNTYSKASCSSSVKKGKTPKNMDDLWKSNYSVSSKKKTGPRKKTGSHVFVPIAPAIPNSEPKDATQTDVQKSNPLLNGLLDKANRIKGDSNQSEMAVEMSDAMSDISDPSVEDSATVVQKQECASSYVTVKSSEPFNCIECGTKVTSDHFLSALNCHCGYSTHCVKSFVNHQIQVHAILREKPKTHLRLRAPVHEKKCKCVCGFSTRNGNRLASHMKRKRHTKIQTPLPPMVQKQGSLLPLVLSISRPSQSNPDPSTELAQDQNCRAVVPVSSSNAVAALESMVAMSGNAFQVGNVPHPFPNMCLGMAPQTGPMTYFALSSEASNFFPPPFFIQDVMSQSAVVPFYPNGGCLSSEHLGQNRTPGPPIMSLNNFVQGYIPTSDSSIVTNAITVPSGPNGMPSQALIQSSGYFQSLLSANSHNLVSTVVSSGGVPQSQVIPSSSHPGQRNFPHPLGQKWENQSVQQFYHTLNNLKAEK